MYSNLKKIKINHGVLIENLIFGDISSLAELKCFISNDEILNGVLNAKNIKLKENFDFKGSLDIEFLDLGVWSFYLENRLCPKNLYEEELTPVEDLYLDSNKSKESFYCKGIKAVLNNKTPKVKVLKIASSVKTLKLDGEIETVDLSEAKNLEEIIINYGAHVKNFILGDNPNLKHINKSDNTSSILLVKNATSGQLTVENLYRTEDFNISPEFKGFLGITQVDDLKNIVSYLGLHN